MGSLRQATREIDGVDLLKVWSTVSKKEAKRAVTWNGPDNLCIYYMRGIEAHYSGITY